MFTLNYQQTYSLMDPVIRGFQKFKYIVGTIIVAIRK
jgi:hypothetical protein